MLDFRDVFFWLYFCFLIPEGNPHQSSYPSLCSAFCPDNLPVQLCLAQNARAEAWRGVTKVCRMAAAVHVAPVAVRTRNRNRSSAQQLGGLCGRMLCMQLLCCTLFCLEMTGGGYTAAIENYIAGEPWCDKCWQTSSVQQNVGRHHSSCFTDNGRSLILP